MNKVRKFRTVKITATNNQTHSCTHFQSRYCYQKDYNYCYFSVLQHKTVFYLRKTNESLLTVRLFTTSAYSHIILLRQFVIFRIRSFSNKRIIYLLVLLALFASTTWSNSRSCGSVYYNTLSLEVMNFWAGSIRD